MKYFSLPHTDLKFSAICLGTDGLVGRYPESEIFELFDLYVSLGGNIIDTALIYSYNASEHSSEIEKLIGRWVKSRANQHSVTVATKGAHYIPLNDTVPRLSFAQIEIDLNSSLRNLDTECIDLYWLHRDDPEKPAGEIIESLNEFKKQGKIRYFACSNWTPDRMKAAAAYAESKGLAGFVADQMSWSLAKVNPGAPMGHGLVYMDKADKEFHAESGMPAMPYSSQAKGFFSKLLSGADIGEKTKGRYLSDINLQIFDRLKQVAADTGIAVSQLALAWLIAHPFITIPIVGCKTALQLKDSMAAADVELDQETAKFIYDI